jgi:hypothetical protein
LVEEGRQRVATLKKTNAKAVFYGDKELGGLHVMYVLDDTSEVYGLPTAPEVPPAALVRDVIKWVGAGAAIAILAGFALNYIVAREAKMTSDLPGKEFIQKKEDKQEK